MARVPISLSLSFALLLTGCATPAPNSQMLPQAASEVEERCGDLAAVDIARIPLTVPHWSRFEQFHRLARAGVAPAPQSSGIQLKLAIPGGGFQNPYGLSVFAARQSDGTWRVSHVRYLQLPPPPQPPGTPPLPSPPERVVTTGTLTPAAAQRIEAALASDCLKREPFLSLAALPMKNGPDLLCPPDAAVSNALEIVEGSKSRRYLRECGRTWASGTIIIVLENSENLIPDA